MTPNDLLKYFKAADCCPAAGLNTKMTQIDSRTKTLLLIAAIIAALALLWIVSRRYLSLTQVKEIAAWATVTAKQSPLIIAAVLVLTQAVGMTLSLPTKAVLTFLAGALLGPLLGTVVTQAGVLAGTTVLFFVARKLLRERVATRLGERAKRIEQRVASRPIRAVAGMRLIITLPYGSITLATALTSIRYRDFLLGSLLGDTPVIALYAFAGQRLASLTTTGEAISPLTVLALSVAGLLLVVSTIVGRRSRL